MALRKYYMHLSHQTFEELEPGIVRVTNQDGKSGVFRWDGPWIEGEVRDVNINMLVFTGGPDTPAAFNFRWVKVPADIERASGWPEDIERHLIASGTL